MPTMTNGMTSTPNMWKRPTIAAFCATVDQVGNESDVMKKTFKAFAIILVLYMVLAMLYTCVLFPNFGM